MQECHTCYNRCQLCYQVKCWEVTLNNPVNPNHCLSAVYSKESLDFLELLILHQGMQGKAILAVFFPTVNSVTTLSVLLLLLEKNHLLKL